MKQYFIFRLAALLLYRKTAVVIFAAVFVTKIISTNE